MQRVHSRRHIDAIGAASPSHGNGTEDIFKNDPRVMLCSTFQHPFHPHCCTSSGSGHIINTPLPAGTDSTGFRAAVLEHWLPNLEAFRPEMLFISAGFDAHREDGMAGMALVDADYGWVTGELKTLAEKLAQGRIVSVLEEGCALSALGRSAAAHQGVEWGLTGCCARLAGETRPVRSAPTLSPQATSCGALRSANAPLYAGCDALDSSDAGCGSCLTASCGLLTDCVRALRRRERRVRYARLFECRGQPDRSINSASAH
jgi:hypothetical protein